MLKLQELLYQPSAPTNKHPDSPRLEYSLTVSTKDYETEEASATVPHNDNLTEEDSAIVPPKDYLTEEEALKGKPLTEIKETVSVELSTVRLIGKWHYSTARQCYLIRQNLSCAL